MLGVGGVDLDLGDAAVEVAHQAAAGARLAQSAHPGRSGFDADELERAGRFGV